MSETSAGENGSTRFRASVVVPTYNRGPALAHLLEQFTAQSVPLDAFEVVVVDDGSAMDPTPQLEALTSRLHLRVERQKNQGAARARQRGAELSRGALLIFLDDDMSVGPEFVAAHLAAHEGRSRAAVLGQLAAVPRVAERPLFERYHARMLDRIARDAEAAGPTLGLPGPKLYTGNMSVPRSLFFEAGGFDGDFRLLEDVELGIRLERAGGRIFFSKEAVAIHASDHISTEGWLGRSLRDGVYASKLAHKHPDYAPASPFWHIARINRLSRPVLFASAAAPKAGAALAQGLMKLAEAADGAGLSRAAVAGTTLVYGIQFYRGVREESGGLGDFMRDYRSFKRAVQETTDTNSKAGQLLLAAIQQDHAMLQKSQGKYGLDAVPRSLATEAVQNIGLQILIAYRTMRALHAGGHANAAKVMSRLIRHLYGSDIHWEADLAPGIVIVHGFGLAISKAAKVGEGSILYHGVTLGLGRDGVTGKTGAPVLERDVHVGVGATLVGPITVGHETKIMAGCTLMQSVPPRSLVQSPPADVRQR